MILNQDGSPWPHANLYLLSKLKSITPPAYKTLECIAIDLQHFRRWLVDENVDYLKFLKNIFGRPTYKYCAYLHDEINHGRINRNTAKRRMNAIQHFYRWLEYSGKRFDYPLWQEQDTFIAFKDDKGFVGSKRILTTDLSRSIKIPKNCNNYDNYLSDGGKLRPLEKIEQKALIHALKNIANPEMTLAFLIALTTGARLQTVFTLRRCHFEESLFNTSDLVTFKVGIRTLIDTKYDKSMVLLFPAWLYERIYIYMKSKRALRRLELSPYVYDPPNTQYLFLTHTGLPYYISKTDPFIEHFKIPPKGNAIAQFILQQLKPTLKRMGHSFSIRYHDLRATFGMNLLEEKLSQLSDSADFFTILVQIRDRMGHASIATTESYLNYQRETKLAVSIQSEFEKYMMEHIGG